LKKHLLIVTLALICLFSSCTLAFAADKCPTCRGTGEITERRACPTCQGSSAPDIVLKRTIAGASSSNPLTAATVTGIFHNNEIFEVKRTVTAQVKTTTQTFTNTSTANFPPQSDVTLTLTVAGVKYEQYWSYLIRLTDVNSIECDDCNGNGYVTVKTTCPDCGGTGLASGFAVTNLEGVGGAVIGVIAVGVVVVTGFFVVKKRRVTEESLRRLTSFEFQAWVVKKMGANSASQRGTYLGVDAFSAEGYPVQIRQEDDVGKRSIDSFAVAVSRNKAKNGSIVAFSFGNDAYEGVMRARLNYRLEIKTVTIKELLANRDNPF